MHIDSNPWGTFLVFIGIFGLVITCRYTCLPRYEAESITGSGTKLQQVLVVHPDGEEAIAKILKP